MRHAQIALMDDEGAHVWSGSLHQFATDNSMDRAETSALIRELRQEQAPAIIGGGAAPMFYMSLAS